LVTIGCGTRSVIKSPSSYYSTVSIGKMCTEPEQERYSVIKGDKSQSRVREQER
jgi:hypothetical protein